MRLQTPLWIFVLLICCFSHTGVSGGAAKVIGGIVKSLLEGLASGIGASALFGQIPESLPSYFTEVYKEIERIMHEKITTNTINEIDGKINGLTRWVKNTYNPRKRVGEPKVALHDILQRQESGVVIDMMGILTHSTYAEAALGVFVIGASMHLSLLQELALVDPSASSPSSSSYAISIQKYAKQYASHAQVTYDKIAARRTSGQYISGPSWKIGSCSGGRMIMRCTRTLRWTDMFTGQTFSPGSVRDGISLDRHKLDTLKNQGKKDIENYKKQLKIKLEASLNKPQASAVVWRKLVTNPIPRQ